MLRNPLHIINIIKAKITNNNSQRTKKSVTTKKRVFIEKLVRIRLVSLHFKEVTGIKSPEEFRNKYV